MSRRERPELGYAFALLRLVARLAGRRVRRAEFSGAEAWTLGLLVYGICWTFLGRLLLPGVRSILGQLLILLALPFAIWAGFLLLYYLNSLLITPFRRLGLYSAVTNNLFQHVVIMSLITGLALVLLRDESLWVKSLGAFWLVLLGANLVATIILRLVERG